MAYVELEKARELLFKFREECINSGVKEDTTRGILYSINELSKLPTADVEEVKRGKWIDEFKSFNAVGSGGAERSYLVGYKCSLCGRSEISKEPYCNCGAKMDGEDTDVPTK